MKTTTRETRRDRWTSRGLIAGALLAGVAAIAAAGPRKQPAPAARQSPAVVAGPGPQAPGPKAVEPATPNAPPVAQAPRPRIELVFALDTTGSMSGLIEGAKRKIWSIASFVARGQPTPELRVGLVAYRDVGDAYVTRVHDLDADLDRVYQRLLALRADGGGDGPEHVARALSDAVRKMSWSKEPAGGPAGGDGQSGQPGVARLIYIVGDAPPHVDYDDGYDYAKAAREAVQRGIQVHAIRCGTDPETGTHWRRIASLGHGEFLTIGQDGGMRDRHTPYDEELARLHDELSDTVVPFGAGAAEMRGKIAAAAAAPAPVKASRAGYLAAKKEIGDDLVAGVASGKIDLGRVADKDLPRALAALPEPERKEQIAAKSKARSDLMGRISKLSDDRAAFLKSQPAEAGPSLDRDVEDTVRKAGAAIGSRM